MGERVEVRPVPPKPTNEAGTGTARRSPLNYARPGLSDRARRLAGLDVMLADLWDRMIRPALVRLGGWRQAGFAVGLALVVGGLGAALRPYGDASLVMGLGGLLIGLSVPLRRRRS